MLRQSNEGRGPPAGLRRRSRSKEAEDPEWVHRMLADAARRIRAEAFAPLASRGLRPLRLSPLLLGAAPRERRW